MGTATYRIGPSDFFTPGDLGADADTLDGQIRVLDQAIDGNVEIPQDQWDAFNVWEASWKKFYSSHFGGFFSEFTTALNDSNRDQLIAFENQFSTWVTTFAKSDVTYPGPVVEPSEGAKDNLSNHLKNALGLDLSSTVMIVLGVLGVFIAWKALK